jgi:chromosome partitioning protein
VARVIAIANQKGGVGKTTTAINLAASLAVAEQRTLLIDGDPQGNATSGMGVQPGEEDRTVYEALIGECALDEAIRRSAQFEHLDIAPATADLAGAEIELVDHPRRELAMRDAVAPVRDGYDYVLIDCPPSLGLITVSMLAAADAILIPVQCEYYALEGLTQLLNTIHLIQRGVNEKLTIDGVLLTMYDARLNLSRQVMADAREYFGSQVFQTVIPRSVRLAEAPSFGKPIILYDVASVGAQAYMSVARELLERHRHDGSRDDADRQHATTPAVEHAAEAERTTRQPADKDTGPTDDRTQQRAEHETSQSHRSEERPLDHTAIEPRPTEERISEPHTAERSPADQPVANRPAVDEHRADEHTPEPTEGDQQRGDSTLSELVHTEPPHAE